MQINFNYCFYRGHSSPIWGVAVSPIANMVATASRDKTARVWNLDRTFPVRILAGHLQDVTVSLQDIILLTQNRTISNVE